MSAAAPSQRESVILVVDDDEGIRENLAELLAMEDYKILTAADAEEALARFDSGTIDLLLTDFQMPGRNGLELIEAARRKQPDLLAILITAYPYVYEQIEPDRRQGVTLLLKPFAADLVLSTVARVLGRS